jgi:GNAT superfamily N-acetyltransferase
MGEGALEYRYDDSYAETVSLAGGKRVSLRLMQPTDREALRTAFDRLSPESRYARFMAPKARLTEAELNYLSRPDGFDHFALVAIRKHLVSTPEGVGVARFVRLTDAPDTAEPAVTVIDDYQGAGLGSILLQRLIEAAWERDVRWFRSELLAENKASRKMIESLSPEVRFVAQGDGSLVATIPVPEPDQTPTAPGFFIGTPVQKLLAYAAQAAIRVRPRVTQPPPPPPPPRQDT